MSLGSEYAQALADREAASLSIEDDCYNATLYLDRAEAHRALGYHDLAAGDAYKALLLLDEITDESGEYHEVAASAFEHSGWDLHALRNDIYQSLVESLLNCECFKDAYIYAKQWHRVTKGNIEFLKHTVDVMRSRVADLPEPADLDELEVEDLPERVLVRREIYPWNDLEPDRSSDDYVRSLNDQIKNVASECEVRVTELPILTGATGDDQAARSFRQGRHQAWSHRVSREQYSYC